MPQSPFPIKWALMVKFKQSKNCAHLENFIKSRESARKKGGNFKNVCAFRNKITNNGCIEKHGISNVGNE